VRGSDGRKKGRLPPRISGGGGERAGGGRCFEGRGPGKAESGGPCACSEPWETGRQFEKLKEQTQGLAGTAVKSWLYIASMPLGKRGKGGMGEKGNYRGGGLRNMTWYRPSTGV